MDASARSFAHRNLPTLLLRARESAMRYFRPRLRAHGLTDQQWRVLRTLDEAGELEVGQVAQAAAIVGPSLSGVLERMERQGLIERVRSAADQRKVLVRPSAAGRAIVDAHRGAIEAAYADIEAAIGREQLGQLYALLDRLLALPDPRDAAAATSAPASDARKQRRSGPASAAPQPDRDA